jgi:hypothetical protein
LDHDETSASARCTVVRRDGSAQRSPSKIRAQVVFLREKLRDFDHFRAKTREVLIIFIPFSQVQPAGCGRRVLTGACSSSAGRAAPAWVCKRNVVLFQIDVGMDGAAGGRCG